MLEKTLFIIGNETPARAHLEKVLSESGWRCLIAGIPEAAQSFENGQNVKVFFVAAEQLHSDEFAAWEKGLDSACQIVAYSDQEPDRLATLKEFDRLFSFLHLPTTSDWQVSKIALRAAELVKANEQRQKGGMDALHRELFQASVVLQGAESQKELLDRTCREIALKAGFGRALLVLADSKFRIQSSHAFFADERHSLSLAHLVGQPLMPVLPNAPLKEIGQGFAQVIEETTQDQALLKRHLILPLERIDGTVFGFLTLDTQQTLSTELSAMSEPLSLLLRLASTLIEMQELRAKLKNLQGNASLATVERSAELRQAQERFNRLVSLTEDIVYLTDPSGRIIYLNNAFTDRLGFARENYVGQMLDAVLADLAAENDLSQSTLTRVRNREVNNTTGEIEIFSKTGYRAIFSISHQWIRQGEDIVAGQGLLKDMTEQRELRAQLTRSERLGMAGQLASGIAHEINNPLQAISSHLAGVRSRIGEDASAIESFSVVADSIERIRLIVRSLLDLQRTEHSVKKKDDLNAVVEKALLLLTPQLRASEIEVTRNLAPDLPPVRINAAEIEQVFLNLILNAIAAMSSGGTLTLASEAAEDVVQVKVADSGTGMSPEILSKLFEPFSTHREHGGGLGLGLYLSGNIIKDHGGEIRAKSQPGKGSEFVIKLPRNNRKTAP